MDYIKDLITSSANSLNHVADNYIKNMGSKITPDAAMHMQAYKAEAALALDALALIEMDDFKSLTPQMRVLVERYIEIRKHTLRQKLYSKCIGSKWVINPDVDKEPIKLEVMALNDVLRRMA